MQLGQLEFVGVAAEALRDDERVMAWYSSGIGPCWVVGVVDSVHVNVTLTPASFFRVYAHEWLRLTTINKASINFYSTFYRLKSKRRHVQHAMEQRAINTLLQRITGDDCFTWHNGTLSKTL